MNCANCERYLIDVIGIQIINNIVSFSKREVVVNLINNNNIGNCNNSSNINNNNSDNKNISFFNNYDSCSSLDQYPLPQSFKRTSPLVYT